MLITESEYIATPHCNLLGLSKPQAVQKCAVGATQVRDLDGSSFRNFFSLATPQWTLLTDGLSTTTSQSGLRPMYSGSFVGSCQASSVAQSMRCNSNGLVANELAGFFDVEHAACPEEVLACPANPKDSVPSAIDCTLSNPCCISHFPELSSLSCRAHKRARGFCMSFGVGFARPGI